MKVAPVTRLPTRSSQRTFDTWQDEAGEFAKTGFSRGKPDSPALRDVLFMTSRRGQPLTRRVRSFPVSLP